MAEYVNGRDYLANSSTRGPVIVKRDGLNEHYPWVVLDEIGGRVSYNNLTKVMELPKGLVLIDSESGADLERLLAAMRAADVTMSSRVPAKMKAALRRLAVPPHPKPYTTHTGGLAPWPVVDECFSSHRPGHECPQCAWGHEHDWVAWDSEAAPGNRRETPIRCSKCGGRKCDLDLCAGRRHDGHYHQAGDPA